MRVVTKYLDPSDSGHNSRGPNDTFPPRPALGQGSEGWGGWPFGHHRKVNAQRLLWRAELGRVEGENPSILWGQQERPQPSGHGGGLRLA